MLANVSHEANLTSKQRALIALLVAGCSIVDAAKQAGVSEKTAHQWLKQAPVKQALQDAKTHVFYEALEEIKAAVPLTLVALKRHLTAPTKPTAHTQMQAVELLLTQAIELHKVQEVEARLAEIEERLNVNDKRRRAT